MSKKDSAKEASAAHSHHVSRVSSSGKAKGLPFWVFPHEILESFLSLVLDLLDQWVLVLALSVVGLFFLPELIVALMLVLI